MIIIHGKEMTVMCLRIQCSKNVAICCEQNLKINDTSSISRLCLNATLKFKRRVKLFLLIFIVSLSVEKFIEI